MGRVGLHPASTIDFSINRSTKNQAPLFANPNQLAIAILRGGYYPAISGQATMAAYLSQILRRQRPCPPQMADAIIRAIPPKRLTREQVRELRDAIDRELGQPVLRAGSDEPSIQTALHQLRARGRECRNLVFFAPPRAPYELSRLLGDRDSWIIATLANSSAATAPSIHEYYFSLRDVALDFWDHMLTTAERALVRSETSLQAGKVRLRQAEEDGRIRAYLVPPELNVFPLVVLDPLSASEAAYLLAVSGENVNDAMMIDASTLESWYRLIHRPLREGVIERLRIQPRWITG